MTEVPPIDPKMEAGWKAAMAPEFSQPYFAELVAFLKKEKALGKTIYPPGGKMFAAFDHTPWEQVRVVILGQDPYHGPGQANGLCFSVAPGVRPPPSLKNMFKEMATDVGADIPEHGDLRSWATQGVLLINAILSVEAHQAASHRNQGWERFTDAVISTLSREKEGVVFLLWGGYAKKKAALIDAEKHHILMAAHPSPLSAHNGFFGCGHFSKTNVLLRDNGMPEIAWALPPVES